MANDLALPMRVAWSLFGTPVLGWPLRRFQSTLNSRADAGRSLANLALGIETPTNGSNYAALRRGRINWTEPSELARDEDAVLALWDASARLVGLPDQVGAEGD